MPTPSPDSPLPDPIHVQLVGDPWWNDWLAWVAIAISVATLVFTLITRHRDGARIKIEL
jgi:hypothetical protein